MKAILILDEMPENCLKCPIGKNMSIPLETCIQCPLGKCAIDTETEIRPDWCPLKEAPQKQTIYSVDTPHHRWAKDGYNACIDEILGDKE